MDGTQCSITLDLEYNVLPHRADSFATAALINDMKMLSASNVEVVQLIPLPSVDASLIYGVPISARAGLEVDLIRYKEMQLLVRQLWKYLATNDVAVLMRCTCQKVHGNNEGSFFVHQSLQEYGCYFHEEGDDQLFLLMAEEVVEESSSLACPEDCQPKESVSNVALNADKKKAGSAPGNGILYRYAMSDQFLRDVKEGSSLTNYEANSADGSNNNVDAEASLQYFDYIERSLEYLERSGLNPILLEDIISYENEETAVATTRTPDSHMADDKNVEKREAPQCPEEFWAEESGVGVGSRVEYSEEEEGNDEIDPYDLFPSFDYQ
uniref:Uncharacterized protein n=1 Tax=Ditylum brightwellii TaxID=49249 RepID=A0A7S4QXI8_9STRA